MKCSRCPYRREVVKGKLVDFFCEFTGAQVGPFQFHAGGHDGLQPVVDDDDPNLPCALSLERVLRVDGGGEMVAGILRVVAARGLLERLLGAYRGTLRQRLESLVVASGVRG